MRFMPGCECCGCILLVDEFSDDSIASYTQVSGTWTISDGTLHTDSTSGLIVRGVTLTGTDCTVEGKVRGDTDGDIVGLVFGYTDVDNYYRFVLEVSDTGDFCGNLKLIKKQTSVDSTLLNYDLMWVEIDKLHKLSACIEEDYYPAGITIYLKVTFNNGVIWRFEIVDTTPLTTSHVGFMTDPNSGTASFDSLIVREHENNDPVCPDCAQVCLIADYDDSAPPRWFSNTDHHCEFLGGKRTAAEKIGRFLSALFPCPFYTPW